MSSVSRAPLNDRLRFVTEAGKIDHVGIFADIPRKAAEKRRRYLEAGGRHPNAIEWRAEAEADLYTQANGELQLREIRKLTREQGLQTVADLIAPFPVGPFNDNYEAFNEPRAQFDAALNAVRFHIAAE